MSLRSRSRHNRAPTGRRRGRPPKSGRSSREPTTHADTNSVSSAAPGQPPKPRAELSYLEVYPDLNVDVRLELKFEPVRPSGLVHLGKEGRRVGRVIEDDEDDGEDRDEEANQQDAESNGHATPNGDTTRAVSVVAPDGTVPVDVKKPVFRKLHKEECSVKPTENMRRMGYVSVEETFKLPDTYIRPSPSDYSVRLPRVESTMDSSSNIDGDMGAHGPMNGHTVMGLPATEEPAGSTKRRQPKRAAKPTAFDSKKKSKQKSNAKHEDNTTVVKASSDADDEPPLKVDYDMDDQDKYFLEDWNRRRTKAGQAPLTEELFEYTITLMETEWFDIEKRMPPKKKALPAVDPASEKCVVCDESECDNSNAIVFCDGCDIAVHQDCYGIPWIPDGQWLCQQCRVSRKRKAACIFCPNKTGAFKPTDSQHWAHIVCGIWLPETIILNAVYMEPISGLQHIPKSRWKLNCYICQQKIGACIQCINKSCFQAFHPTCAQRAGLCMTMQGGIQGAMYDKGGLAAYCDRHTPPEYAATHDVRRTLSEAMRFYSKEFKRHQYDVEEANIVEHRRKFKRRAGAWRTEEDVPVLPKLVVTRVISALTPLFAAELSPKSGGARSSLTPRLSQDLETFVYDMARYWVLKRQRKRGAALSKRLQLAIEYARHHHFSKSEAQERLEKLENDMSRAKDLEKIVDAVAAREQVKSELANVDAEMAAVVYFPVERRVAHVWQALIDLDSKADLLDPDLVGEIGEKVRLLQYNDVDAFAADVERLLETSLADCQRKSKEWGVCSRYKKTMAPLLAQLREYPSTFRKKDESSGLPDLRNFDPQGLLVHDEQWTGRRVMQELSDPLTDLDSDEYEELVSASATRKRRKLRSRR